MSTARPNEVLALIPARGGSKAIPRKNLLEIAGKPLLAYSIEQALECDLVTRTIVSTDDEEIADVARQFGAEVPFIRPSEFAGDLSPDFDVFLHALQWLRDQNQYLCEMVLHLRPTGPVRRPSLIKKAIQMMLDQPEADALRSVSPAMQTPYKMWELEDGLLKQLLDVEEMAEPYCQPRQVLPQVYWQNGYIDIVRSRAILEQGLMCGRRIIPLIVNDPVHELDYVDDVPALEEAVQKMQQGEFPQQQDTKPRHSV
ncbi:MAG: acylneuraminate cytidylyltransferase family protein [Pirellulales bacterium]|nr:acylneuraminate cytidylyltransferase family protein [Pirellulales bacterium]